MPTFGWQDGPGGNTPLDAAELEAFGQFIANYAQSLVASGGLVPTTVKTGNYTAAVGDFVPVDITGGSVTITLPTAPAVDSRIGVELVRLGTPGVSQVTIALGGADVFDAAGGPTTTTISALDRSLIMEYKGGVWYRISSNPALGAPLGAAVLGTDGTVGGPGGSPLNPAIVSATGSTAGTVATSLGSNSYAWDPSAGGGGGGGGGFTRSVKDAAYGAQGGALVFTSGAVISGATLSDTGHHPFTAGKVGQTVILDGAGTAGVAYSTTIAAFTDTGHVTLTAAPPNPGGMLGSYRFGPDDTASFSLAATTTPGDLLVPTDNYIVSSFGVAQGLALRGKGAHLWKIPSTNQIVKSFIADGVTERQGLTVFGISFHGEGLNGYTAANANGHGAIYLEQWENIHVRECNFDGFPDTCIYYADCERSWSNGNWITNQGVNQGRNAIAYFGTTTGTASSTPTTDHFAEGNHIETHCAGIVYTAAGAIVQTQAFRGIWRGNTVHCFADSAFCCIGLEMASGGGTGAQNQRSVIIAENVLIQDSTSAQGVDCIFVSDSGTSADPTKQADIVISGNTCTIAGAAGNGAAIKCNASRSVVTDNTITVTGTGRGILVGLPTSASVVLYTTVSNNRIQMAGAHTQSAIDTFQMQGGRIIDNAVTYTAGTATAGSHGISVASGVATEVQRNRIDSPGGCGVVLATAAQDVTVTDNSIRNANDANGTSAPAAAGISFNVAAPAGTRNLIDRNEIFDDRGPAQMRHAIYSAATSGTLPIFGTSNIISGWLTAATNVAVTAFGSTGFQWAPDRQGPMRETTVSSTAATTEQGLVAETGGITLSPPLPTSLQPSDYSGKSWVFTNATAASVNITTGTTGKINPFTGGNNNSTFVLPAGASLSLVPRVGTSDWYVA